VSARLRDVALGFASFVLTAAILAGACPVA
jgi:hypothetical protein